jgi:hypothetical protein
MSSNKLKKADLIKRVDELEKEVLMLRAFKEAYESLDKIRYPAHCPYIPIYPTYPTYPSPYFEWIMPKFEYACTYCGKLSCTDTHVICNT